MHELAHAHDVNFLTDRDRAEFLSVRDADSRRNEKWARAAGEHFADVVAWGISGGAVRPSRTFPNDNASLDLAVRAGRRLRHIVELGETAVILGVGPQFG